MTVWVLFMTIVVTKLMCPVLKYCCPPLSSQDASATQAAVWPTQLRLYQRKLHQGACHCASMTSTTLTHLGTSHPSPPQGYKNAPRQYIATQGPMDNTIEDFWRMCWENNVEVIVMATNFQERGIVSSLGGVVCSGSVSREVLSCPPPQDKCARYWPAQGSEEYGNIEVTLVQQTAHQTHSASNLHVRDLGVENSEVRTVRHYRLTCWPHQGVPRSSKQVTDFLR